MIAAKLEEIYPPKVASGNIWQHLTAISPPTGITCLMIAAKLEEIYPPKVADFAYVTDGACTQEDIQDKELVIMKVGEGEGREGVGVTVVVGVL